MNFPVWQSSSSPSQDWHYVHKELISVDYGSLPELRRDCLHPEMFFSTLGTVPWARAKQIHCHTHPTISSEAILVQEYSWTCPAWIEPWQAHCLYHNTNHTLTGFALSAAGYKCSAMQWQRTLTLPIIPKIATSCKLWCNWCCHHLWQLPPPTPFSIVL